MLPDGTGEALLHWVRSTLGWELPTLVLTARDDEQTVVTALQAGADDCVVKPPKQLELAARVAELGRCMRSGGEPVVLTQKEFDLSAYLFQNPANCCRATTC
jgi:two-component system response regulator RegX3